MRTKRFSLSVVLAVLIMFVGSAAGAETIKLNLATIFPSEHAAYTEGIQGWVESVQEATDGRVKVMTYPGQTLVNAGNVLEAVKEGAVDIGHDPASYTPGTLPLLTAFQLGGIEFDSGKVASYVAWDIIKNDLVPLKELNDVKVLFFYAISPGNLHMKEPVRSLQDLEGMEIRTSAPSTISQIGATPVSVPMTETYQALQKGVADGVLAPDEALEGWRLAEVTEYTTITPFLYSDVHLITMNKDKWNSLPADIQDAIEKVNKKHFENVTSVLWDEIDKSGMKFAIEETGQEVIELSEAQKEKWIEKLQPLHEQWIQKMEKRDLPARKMLETIKSLAEKYNKKFQ
ncbi:MAG: TRAP transporter substrate-binding protein [Desulfobacteraceae bacterium]|nr:TRAP transporter substrate-binding protein [Desulfobacteraceae bacterium]